MAAESAWGALQGALALPILALAGILSPDAMAAKRPYVIVGAFVVGMLLTPPDVLSQFLMAIPMWMLFEVGVLIGKVIEKRRPAPVEDAG